jgi:hypothetical protein
LEKRKTERQIQCPSWSLTRLLLKTVKSAPGFALAHSFPTLCSSSHLQETGGVGLQPESRVWCCKRGRWRPRGFSGGKNCSKNHFTEGYLSWALKSEEEFTKERASDLHTPGEPGINAMKLGSTHHHTAAGSPRRWCHSEPEDCWRCGTTWKEHRTSEPGERAWSRWLPATQRSQWWGNGGSGTSAGRKEASKPTPQNVTFLD